MRADEKGTIMPGNDSKNSNHSLARKLAQFDAGLPPEERDVFRSRILEAIFQNEDVEGHAMQMSWGEDANGIYFQWIASGDGDGGQQVRRTDSLGSGRFSSASSDKASSKPSDGDKRGS
jgi:hypothetical protein